MAKNQAAVVMVQEEAKKAFPSTTINITFGAYMQPLRVFCDKEKITISHLVRQLVATHLRTKGVKIVKGNPFGMRQTANTHVQVSLTKEEFAFLKTCALKENIHPSTWLIQSLQEAMAMENGSFIGRGDLKAMAVKLDDVQRELSGMARNLNQIARALNRATRDGGKEVIPLERLLVLKEIESHLLDFVKPAQAVLSRLENPRLSPYPHNSKNEARQAAGVPQVVGTAQASKVIKATKASKVGKA